MRPVDENDAAGARALEEDVRDLRVRPNGQVWLRSALAEVRDRRRHANSVTRAHGYAARAHGARSIVVFDQWEPDVLERVHTGVMNFSQLEVAVTTDRDRTAVAMPRLVPIVEVSLEAFE